MYRKYSFTLNEFNLMNWIRSIRINNLDYKDRCREGVENEDKETEPREGWSVERYIPSDILHITSV